MRFLHALRLVGMTNNYMQKSFFVPGNISCFFTICENPDPAKKGSMGLGFTINKGVTVSVSKTDKNVVFFNGKEIKFPTVRSAVEHLQNTYSSSEERNDESRSSSRLTPLGGVRSNNNIEINISSPLPLGSGFGLSGASVLATAYAVNELFSLNKQKLQLAKIAHVAEVKNGTGLGDVTNEYFKGLLLKTVPSSQFKVYRLPLTNIPVYCKYFSPLHTKSILSSPEKFNQINKAGAKALDAVKTVMLRASTTQRDESRSSKNNSSRLTAFARTIKEKKILFAELISISKQFAQESGLLIDKQVIQTIQGIESRGGHASMVMLGNAVFSDIPFPGSEEYIITD